MSLSPPITLDLVDSDTMTRLSGLSEATNRSFKPIYNGAGTFSLSMPIGCEAAYKVRNRKTGILFTRDGRPVWSGAITSINRHAAAGTVDITAMGWLEELEARFVRRANETSLTFGTATVGGLIFKGLLDQINAQTDSGGTTRPVRARFGVANDVQTRTTSYREGDQASAKYKELIDVEDGFDLTIDPSTRLITTRDPGAFTYRTNVKFGYGVFPYNLADVDEVDEGSEIRNRINVVAGNGLVYSADDPVAIDEAGVMLEEWINASDIVDPNIALALANAELVYKRYGNKVYKLTPAQFGDLPRPYTDFEWGDAGYLSVDRDSMQVDQLAVRLFSGTLTYTDEGQEIVSELQVVA